MPTPVVVAGQRARCRTVLVEIRCGQAAWTIELLEVQERRTERVPRIPHSTVRRPRASRTHPTYVPCASVLFPVRSESSGPVFPCIP